MRKIILILSFAVMGVLLASACTAQSSQLGSITPTVEAMATAVSPTAVMTSTVMSATPESTTSATTDQKTITLDDQGKTIYLSVGDNFLLKLGNDYTWNVTSSDDIVVSRVKNIAVINGAQGVYDALYAGTVTLTAAGDPQCLQSTPPCAIPSIQFQVTIIVQ